MENEQAVANIMWCDWCQQVPVMDAKNGEPPIGHGEVCFACRNIIDGKMPESLDAAFEWAKS